MDALTLVVVAATCAPMAPSPILAAVALTTTGGAMYAVEIDGRYATHADTEEAIQAVAEHLATGANDTIRLGVAAVPKNEFENRRRAAYPVAFSACENMAVAGELLKEAHDRFGGRPEHWRLAALEYGTGNAGQDPANKFGTRFDDAYAVTMDAAKFLPSLSTATGRTAEVAVVEDTEALATPATRQATHDVFQNGNSQPLLIFSQQQENSR